MKTDLWNRIRDFDLDYPLSGYGFSTRLAHENKWTKNFTKKAILEYKKFMYLAATSERMVSPSHIVDLVWHQHLIFTQSYKSFCEVLGKQIQHIPSTHDKNEVSVFKSAMDNTKKMYTEAFGEQPKEIWEAGSMIESLELPQARISLIKIIIGTCLIIGLLAVPVCILFMPVYAHIPAANFLGGYFVIAIITFLGLEFFNKHYLEKTGERMKSNAILGDLHPMELLYLKTHKLSKIIHGYANSAIAARKVSVSHTGRFRNVPEQKGSCTEEHVLLESLSGNDSQTYGSIVATLKLKPVFANIKAAMETIRKHLLNSKVFGKLFYLNIAILGTLFLAGLARLETGIVREKPSVFIAMLLVAFLACGVIFLHALCKRFANEMVPRYHTKKIMHQPLRSLDWEWQYLLIGSAFFVPGFIPVTNYYDRSEGGYNSWGGTSSCGTSSCGSGCGSSCGGGCGGCGGGCGS